MNARKLIELAAKADGYKYWNPLLDDGDALRLAVNLKLNIEFSESGKTVFVSWIKAQDEKLTMAEPADAKGVRLAIVRAAAEIGCARGEK